MPATKQVLCRIDSRLLIRFRHELIRRDQTIQEALAEMISEYCDKENQ